MRSIWSCRTTTASRLLLQWGVMVWAMIWGGAAYAQSVVPMAEVAAPVAAADSAFGAATIATAERPTKPIYITYEANVVCYGDSLWLEANYDTLTINNEKMTCEWYFNGARLSTANNQTHVVFKPSSNNIRIWFKLYDDEQLKGSDTMTLFVTTRPTTYYTMLHDTICLGDEATIGVQGEVGPDAGNYWDWETSGTTQFINVRPLVSTNYLVYFSQYPIKEYGYKNHCYATDSAHVEVLTKPDVTFVGDSAICIGNEARVEVKDATDIVWFDGTTGAVYRVQNLQKDMILQVRLTDKRGCRGVRTWKFSAVDRPLGEIFLSGDSTICLGDEITMWLKSNADSVIWFNKSNKDTVTFSPKVDMDLYADLFIGRYNLCFTRVYKEVRVQNCLHFYFPTAFKLDGLTKEYKPIGNMEDNKSYYFAIFNRNGMRVFETRDLNVGWDGKYMGEWVSPGVFVFVYQETFDRFTLEHQGTITVIK